MEFIYYALAGFFGGVLGGMGMGGGTILIPILTIFLKVNQHSAQAANLVSFLPMGAVSLAIHIKNKYVVFDNVLYIIVAGILTCFGGYFLAKSLPSDILKKVFGGFLTALSVLQFITALKMKG